MGDHVSVRNARRFNLFLFFLIVVMIAVLAGIVAIIVYFVLAGTQPLEYIVVCIVLFCITIPLTLLQYYYQKDPLVKKVLLGIMITLLVWSGGLFLSVVLENFLTAELAVLSANLINVAYLPMLAIMVSVLKMPESRKYDPAIGRFVVFFAAVVILIICTSSAYLAADEGTMSINALICIVITGLDVIIMAIAALLILSYMPTGYRYIFAILLMVGILCFIADGMLLITTLGVADFSPACQLSHGALVLVGTLAMVGLSLVKISPTTVEEVDKKLSDTRMQLEDIVMQSPDAMGLFDKSGEIILGNQALYRMFQAYPPGELRFNIFDHIDLRSSDLNEQMARIRHGHIMVIDDLPVHLPSGKDELIYVSVKLFPTFASDGTISGYVSIVQDTTLRKQAEEALKKSNVELERRVKDRTARLEQVNEALQREIEARKADEKQIKESLNEKEVLLKEIHHRVKNNLQIVSSMLSLQSSAMKDPAIVAMNMDSQNRIRTMALIHEKLYQTKNLSCIDFEEYVTSLVRFIQGSYSSGNIRVTIDIDKVWLDIDKAIPCGLIINELFSNCLKHAFRGRDRGEVYIGMRREGDRYRLTVRDDGPGMNADIDISSSATLGLSLVSALISQLEGELQIASRDGTEFTIWFPAGSPEKHLVLPDA